MNNTFLYVTSSSLVCCRQTASYSFNTSVCAKGWGRDNWKLEFATEATISVARFGHSCCWDDNTKNLRVPCLHLRENLQAWRRTHPQNTASNLRESRSRKLMTTYSRDSMIYQKKPGWEGLIPSIVWFEYHLKNRPVIAKELLIPLHKYFSSTGLNHQ